jgi:hypothetical protein
MHFPVDLLKIDASFVNGVLHDPIDRGIAQFVSTESGISRIELVRCVGADSG